MNENNLNNEYNELIKSILRTNRKMVEQMKIVCLSVIIGSTLTVGSLVGGALYFFSAFSVETTDEITTTYEQQTDGDSSIVNGNQYKDNSTHKEGEE